MVRQQTPVKSKETLAHIAAISNETGICIHDQPQFKMWCDRCGKGVTDLY